MIKVVKRLKVINLFKMHGIIGFMLNSSTTYVAFIKSGSFKICLWR